MEKILQTAYGDIHYWISDVVEKTNETIFFMHGLTANHDLFANQVNYFEKNYNVIVWDAPAHGASRPFTDFTYEKAAFAVKEILDTNDIRKVVLVGQSLGGYIAQSVIKRFPEMVLAFISIDSTPFGEEYYSKSDKWWLRQIEWMAKMYPEKTLKKAIAKQCTVSALAYENMQKMLSSYKKNELCHLMAIGYAGFLDDNCKLDIKCPVMLIVGKKDRTGKVQQYNKMWSEKIGVPITWISDAAHNANDDQPEIVNKEILHFLLFIFKGAGGK